MALLDLILGRVGVISGFKKTLGVSSGFKKAKGANSQPSLGPGI